METIDIILILGSIFLLYYILQIIYDYKKSVSYPIPSSTPSCSNPSNQAPKSAISLSLGQLSKYDGIQEPATYISIKHMILDVSGSEHYAPEGSYRIFVGKDVSVALAKMSFDEKYFNCYGQVIYRGKGF
jgi:predicted heme/steroid binding protein